MSDDDGSTAIPNTAVDIKLKFYTCDEEIPFKVMEELGTLLTAQYVIDRFTEPKKITNADLKSNEKIIQVRQDIFMKRYRKLLNSYKSVGLMAT